MGTRQGIAELLDQMVGGQKARLAALGRRIRPGLAEEDLVSPDDVPQLRDDPHFMYEAGVLAGLLAAQAALRAWERED